MSKQRSVEPKQLRSAPGLKSYKIYNRPVGAVGVIRDRTTNVGPVSHNATEEFIDDIRQELRAGYGFVPLLGAGFSVSAGIPIIKQLAAYLRRCICVALGAENDALREDQRQLWNPRTDQWPPFIDYMRPEPGKWQDQVYDEYLAQKTLDEQLHSQGGRYSNTSVFQEAFGAMAEWRSSLHFLSRLTTTPRRRTVVLETAESAERDGIGLPRVERRLASGTQLSLGIPQQEVIDACFREVMRDKHPSLNHKMLAALSSLLRIDLILSTNFDNLLEQAFENIGSTLQIFEVQLGTGLPDWSAVSQVRALVKINGGQSSLRADYSLDSSPSAEDKLTFVRYIAGGSIPAATLVEDNKNHLIILGVGAAERRTLDLLKHAWDTLPHLKFFWVCYSEDQVDNVRRATEEFGGAAPLKTRSFILRHTELGLLLLHLHQKIRRNLPTTGTVFPSVTRIPLPPLPDGSRRGTRKAKDGPANRFIKDLQDRLLLRNTLTNPRIVVATSEDSAAGVTSACAELFRLEQSKAICLWIDMNDITNADDLFEVFQETAYYNLGQMDWTPLYATKDNRPRKEEIRRISESGDKEWIVFLNAREKAGANRIHSDTANGWIDTDHNGAFVSLIEELSDPKNGRISVVLLCRHASPGIVAQLDGYEPLFLKKSAPPLDKSVVAEKALLWTAKFPEQQAARRHFLQALVLMQRSRLYATPWDESFNPDAAWYTKYDQHRERWFRDLENLQLLRWKDGGFIWLYSGVRETIRALLHTPEEVLSDPNDLVFSPELAKCLYDWQPAKTEALVHRGLSRWYQKVFLATNVAAAIFEAVDHLCFATEGSLRRKGGSPERTPRAVVVDITNARNLLKQHSFVIQTQGHPRGSLRRLDFIRDFWFRDVSSGGTSEETHYALLSGMNTEIKREIAKLQCVTVFIAQAIYREIGEDSEAFDRQRELGVRMINNVPLTRERVDQILRGNLKRRPQSLSIARALANEQLSNLVLSFDGRAHQEHGRLIDWVRWWRWCAALGVGSRCMKETERSLYRALSALQSGRIHMLRSEQLPLEGWLEDFDLSQLAHSLKDRSHAVRVEALHTFELCIVVLLMKDQVRRRVETLTHRSNSWSKDERASVDRLMANAEAYVKQGLALADSLRSQERDADEIRNYRIGWCKARLLMHYAMVSMRLQHDKSVQRHAMSFLSDAALCLEAADPNRRRGDQTLVELNRAEVRLHEAAEVKLYGEFTFEAWTYDRLDPHLVHNPRFHRDDNEVALREAIATSRKLRDDHTKVSHRGDSLSAVTKRGTTQLSEESSEQLIGNRLREELHSIRALASDALRYLERAEPILRERRRNVWWATWFFERRLRTIALILWASVVERNRPIPFLGLEASMRLTQTQADMLLTAAVRMIRVDEVRLSMVILSYASCARALQVRLEIDKDTVKLPERLKQMRLNLETARTQLTQVQERRNAVRNIAKDGTDPLDKTLIEEALRRIKGVEQSLPK